MVKDVVDDYLFLLESELKCHKSTRVIYQERLLHTEHLIIDLEKKILEYTQSKSCINKELLE